MLEHEKSQSLLKVQAEPKQQRKGICSGSKKGTMKEINKGWHHSELKLREVLQKLSTVRALELIAVQSAAQRHLLLQCLHPVSALLAGPSNAFAQQQKRLQW